MTEEYKLKHTKSWSLIEKKGNVELWDYFDTIEWKRLYAIIMGDSMTTFDGSDANPYTVLEIISQL